MALIGLAARSLMNRKTTALLTVLAIAVSVSLLLGVERIRKEAHQSFLQTISGTDLIVGARSSPVQLLLYSVFRMGNATNNLSWQSYQQLQNHRAVSWTIPISLGDSHRGYKVMGTTEAYFSHFRYAGKQALQFQAGRAFEDLFDVVLGAEVARKLGYGLGDSIVVAHGGGSVSFMQHDDKPFRVVGILHATGTPVDRTVHVSLEAIEAIHVDWQTGVQARGSGKVSAEQARQLDLTPQAITAVLVGLKSKIATFQVQREMNEYRPEPLSAIIPGVALQELWQLIGVAEKALLGVSALVVLSGLIGMMTNLLTSLNERRREMAILRSVGARPWHIFTLLIFETLLLSLLGCLAGLALLYAVLIAAKPFIESQLGFYLSLAPPSASDWMLLALVAVLGTLMGLIPAWRAYRQSLSDGLSVRI